jgi:NAD/NADP transhydrogenase alpha subunit
MSLLLWAAARTSRTPLLEIAGGRVGPSAVAVLLLVAGLAGAKLLAANTIAGALVAILAMVAGFVAVSWRWILGDAERSAMTRTFRSYTRSLPRTAVSG